MIGFGSGKVILCGEHVVVHNEPALVASLPLKTRVDIVPFAGQLIIDNRPKHPGYFPYKEDLYEAMALQIANVFHMGSRYSYVLTGNLPVTSGGIGASAAAAAGITRALCAMLKSPITDREVMEIALLGERKVHGNPSGIDTTAAVLDGVLLFRKEELVLFHNRIAASNPALPLLLVDSQKTTNTKETIAAVTRFKENNYALWQLLMMEYRKIFNDAMRAIKNFDMPALGKQLNLNQDLLDRLMLSCCHVQRVRDIAFQLGALGAKNTGSCRGGLVLVLGRDSEHVEAMTQTFRQQGYFVIDASANLH